MAVTIGELLVNLRASTAAFAKDLDKAQQLSLDSAKEIERSFTRVSGVIVTELGAAATAITAAVAGAIENADKMGILAHQAGLTADQFTALAYAANLSDVSAETLNSALVNLSKNLEKSNQETQEGAAAHTALATLYSGSIPTFKNTNDAFLDIVQRLHDLGPGYQQTALASQIFGRQLGAQLVPMLDSKKGMAELAEEAKSLGVVISDDLANKANQLDDTVLKIEDGLKGLALRVAVDLLPYLQKLADQFLDSEKNAQKFDDRVQSLAAGVKILATGAVAIYGALRFIADGAAEAYVAITLLGQALVNPQTDWKSGIEQLKALDKQWEDDTRSTISTIRGLWTDLGKTVASSGSAGGGGGGLAGGLSKSQKDLQSAIDATVASLSHEINELTLGANATQLYELQVKGANDAILNYVQTLQTYVERLKDGRDVLTGLPPLVQSTADVSGELDTTWQDLYEQGVRLWYDTRTNIEKYALAQNELNAVVAAFPEFADAAKQKLQELAQQLGLVAQPEQKLHLDFRAFARDMVDGFAQAIVGARSFGDVLRRLVVDLEEAILKTLVFQQISSALSGKTGILGFIGSIFGGFRASGGPVSAGTSYVVGEKGPEIFTPSTSGMIVPNGGAGVQVVYNIDARGSSITEQQFRRSLKDSEDRAVARALVTQRELSLRTA